MSWIHLVYKDIREHALSLFSLCVGFLIVLLVAFEQQRSGTFNLSTFQVVRFSLVTIIPLIAFIVGNRLVVREYTGGTRKFVEALPIRPYVSVLIKFILGLVYILLLSVAVVLMAAVLAEAAEDVTQRYVFLLLMKTCAIGCLIWSVVFFASFTGRIRLVIYVVMGLAVMYFMRKPSFDETGFPPFALLQNDLFVFERDVIPWTDLIGTLLVALVFVLSGFSLALINEGSVAEQLGKPVSRRDIAAYALLGMGCLTVYTALEKKWDVEKYSLSGNTVLRTESPEIAVSYLNKSNEVIAEKLAAALNENITGLQTAVGLNTLPQVQISLNAELERTEIEPQLLDGVFVSANFVDFDAFENGLLRSVAMHHLLLSLTTGRWDYETRHWLLDGLARWWSEGGEAAAASVNNSELFALAWISKERMASYENPLLVWQTITDQHGFEGADALSYTAVLYLESIMGADTVVQLTADYINEDVGTTSLESVKRFFNQDTLRFKRITGLSFDAFTNDWLDWLDAKAGQPDVAAFIASVPKFSGEVLSVFDADGRHRLEARYEPMEGYQSGIPGTCVLRHQPASAYDQETMIYTIERDRQNCTTSGVAHSISSPYAKGDRVYGLLEFESEKFHRPIPIWVGRIHIK